LREATMSAGEAGEVMGSTEAGAEPKRRSLLEAAGEAASHPGAPVLLGTVLAAFALGVVLGGGVVSPQSRCMRRYRRLCGRWFAGDPSGYDGCIERAADVCGW
jgi:hypothetical protein